MNIPRLRPHFALAVAVYCGIIFFLSGRENLPTEDLMLWIPGADKIAHAALYGGLAALLSYGLRQSNEVVPFTMQFLGPIAFAALYGLSDEVHQRYVPTRMLDPLDLAADVAGAMVVQLILCLYIWKAPRLDRESSL